MTSEADSGQRPRAIRRMPATLSTVRHHRRNSAPRRRRRCDVVHAKRGDDRGIRRERSSDEGQHQQAGPGAKMADRRHREREASIGKWKRRAYRITDQWAAQARPLRTVTCRVTFSKHPHATLPIPGSLSVPKLKVLFGNGFPIMKRSYLSASKCVALLAMSAAATFSTACGSGPRGVTGEPIRIDGSSTVYPITSAVAADFKKENPASEGRSRLLGHGQRLRALLQGRNRHPGRVPPDRSAGSRRLQGRPTSATSSCRSRTTG